MARSVDFDWQLRLPLFGAKQIYRGHRNSVDSDAAEERDEPAASHDCPAPGGCVPAMAHALNIKLAQQVP
jgi:hypothetical protein